MKKTIFIIALCLIHVSEAEENLNLISGAVVFRHGARNTITGTKNMWSAPLTNEGKLQGFEFGLWLRERYPGLLKKYYDFQELFVRSSQVKRSEMTAETVLTGLYYPLDPKDEWSGKFKVDWSPIPVSSVPAEYDDMLFPNRELYCPELYGIFSETSKNLLLKYPNYTLLKNSSIGEYMTFDTYDEKMIGELLDHYLSNNTWKRLYAGPLIKDIVEKFKSNQTHMNLYAGHDITIIGLMYALDFENKTIKTSFLSSIIFELLVDEQTSISYVKILFKNGPNSDGVVQKIANCEELCPFEQFQRIFEPIIPENWHEECHQPNYFQ